MTAQELMDLNYTKGGNNYILQANADNHWCAFLSSVLNKLKNKYDNSFNIVVYWK